MADPVPRPSPLELPAGGSTAHESGPTEVPAQRMPQPEPPKSEADAQAKGEQPNQRSSSGQSTSEPSGWDPEQNEDLRSARERGRRNFSPGPSPRTVRDSSGVFTAGDSSPSVGVAFGPVVGSINVGLGGRSHLVQQVSREHLDKTATGFALEVRADGTTILDELIGRIRNFQVAVVTGRPGCGRTAMARYGLHAVLPRAERIAMFSLGRQPDQLREMNLSEAAGYVVDIGVALRRRPLDEVVDDLAGHAERDRVRMVVVVDEVQLPEGWARYPLVRHTAPDHARVLVQLLTRVYGRSDRELGSVRELLRGIEPVTMAGLAEAAQAIAAALDADAPPDSYLRNVVRRRTAQKFDQPVEADEADSGGGDDGGTTGMTRAERIHAFRRCFMLAAAAFNGLPLTLVTWTAAQLSNILRADDPDAPAISNLFAQPVEPLLEWLEADLAPASDVATPDRLELRNPVTADVILEHVWTSHHLANGSIITWLDELARIRRDRPLQPDEVRLRAAQAVGRLATYDFSRAVRTIEAWIRSGTVSGLQATSWAVEVMVDDPRIATEVWGQVRDWSLRGQVWRRAALIVYAVGLPSEEVDSALDLARRVAPRPADLDYAVAAVLHSAVLAGAEDEVFATLVVWVQQIQYAREQGRRLRMADRFELRSGLVAHAARTLLLLGGGRDDGTRDRLLRAAAVDPELGAAVVDLWRLALTDPALTERAAHLLGAWLCDADSDDPLAGECARLLAALASDRPLRSRLRFHARRWITDWAGSYPTAERLLRTALNGRRRPEEGTGT